jgi:hypothetical protein
MEIGAIEALAIRTARALPPVRTGRVQAIAGVGLCGDIHADPLSPRQLLLAGAAAYDDLSLPAQALRENLLVDVDTSRLASGTLLQVGSEAVLRLMFQCEACGRLDLQRPGLSQAVGTRRGMLARVVAGGTICAGDTVRDLGIGLPAWSDDWRERVRQVLDALPRDAVIEYKHLARLAGVQSSYCRAFPRLIRNLGPGYAGKAVSSQAINGRARWEGQGLFADEHWRG